jgi:hypothetical protein
MVEGKAVKKVGTRPCLHRILCCLLACSVFLMSCAGPAAGRRTPLSVPDGSDQRAQDTAEDTPLGAANAGQSTQTGRDTAAPETVHITIPSGAQESTVTVRVLKSTPLVPPGAEPLIFTGMGVDQKCGHGEVVAVDGHSLRATPRLPAKNSNFLELLPLGAQVDLIDCRLWTDHEDLSWLAVRTSDKKLGWMLVQSDKFYVTLYPIVLEPPRAATGIPAGATIAYVPPSECKSGPVSTEAMATSIGVDFIPVVGDLKGLGEAATGCDLVTGESLGNWRWLGLLGLVGLAEVAVLRHGDEVADSARMAGRLEGSLRYSDEAASVAGRNADTVADLARGASKLDDVADMASDAARAADKGAALTDDAVRALARFEPPCSFSGDTVVPTGAGPVQISQIRVGDLVLAYNATLETTGYYTVTATSTHVDSTIVSIRVGPDLLVTTPEHPFHVRNTWLQARDLQVGDALTNADGATGRIREVRTTSHAQPMYNLTVAVAHTYFVGSGKWLVHNACGRLLRPCLLEEDSAARYLDVRSVEWQAHHLIPREHEGHVFVGRAKRAGWRFDGASNGIALPSSEEQALALCTSKRMCLPTHRGPHGYYSDRVRAELDRLERGAVSGDWSDARSAQELDKLAQRMQQYVLRIPAARRLN